jgi:hypothetical protein
VYERSKDFPGLISRQLAYFLALQVAFVGIHGLFIWGDSIGSGLSKDLFSAGKYSRIASIM